MQTAKLLFDCLRRMDDEAVTIRDGSPSGLLWYGAHARPSQKRPQSEPCWSIRLAEMLTDAGLQARSEVRYPSEERNRCDLVVNSPSDGRLWIEIKGAWKEYWRGRSERIYRSYLLSPLVKGLESKSHTAPNDIKKLASLGKTEADRVAILLVGFDSQLAPMDDDVAELARLSGLGSAPWKGAADKWDNKRRPGCRVCCWYWWRAVE